MSSFSLKACALLAVGFLAGCDANVKLDPEGYRCDVGNLCPTGYACRDGLCHASVTIDPSCATVSCNTPPSPSCVNGTTVRTFAGMCVAGVCQYAPVDSTCATSCDQGACTDACGGVDCVTPPQAACTDPSTLRTFAQTGTCTMGSCSYVNTDTTCPNGCEAGGCKGVDLCASMGVTCNTPPAATCVGSARRTFASPGTCAPSTGVCTYTSTDSACPNGCALGQCLTANLTFAQTGPRVHFPINGIDVAPGSSGNSVLAVGNAGKLARWDGSMWTELQTSTTSALNKVAFVTGTVAYAVGASRTALTVRPASNQVMPVSLSGSGSANLIAVSGRGEGEVLIADDSGGWWRLRSGAWANGALPGGNGPWAITSAYLDESLRERLVGSCGSGLSTQCVGYRFASGGTPNFVVHTQSGSPGFTAVGGGFDVASGTGSDALLGNADDSLDSHSNLGNFSVVSPSPGLEGDGIVGITAQAVNLGRDVFVLTSSRDPDVSTSGKGSLYRLQKTVGVTSTEVLETYFGEETLSPNEANGVLVAEVRRAQGINNIFRRGVITNEALDVGEDFVGASADDTGALVLVSRYGDLVVRRPTVSTFDFRRPPVTWSIKGLEARHGTGALLVGAEGSSGVIVRVTPTAFTTIATRANTVFNAVCRVSDTEAWAVGSGGVIYRITASSAVQVTSPTTKDLLTVDCAPNVAVAAGADGTVLRMAGGTWTAASPAFPNTTRPITSARLMAQGAYVAGDGFFFSYLAASGTWNQLPAKAGLSSLVVRGPQEVYGAFLSAGTSEILRFDGSAWGVSLLQVSGALGGGVQAGSRVVWGGTLGAIVEAR